MKAVLLFTFAIKSRVEPAVTEYDLKSLRYFTLCVGDLNKTIPPCVAAVDARLGYCVLILVFNKGSEVATQRSKALTKLINTSYIK